MLEPEELRQEVGREMAWAADKYGVRELPTPCAGSRCAIQFRSRTGVPHRRWAETVEDLSATPNGEISDLDLIVRFEPDRSLLDHGGLLMDLRELLG